MKNPKNEKILKTNICSSPIENILLTVRKRLKKEEQTIIYTPNPQILLRAEKSQKYRKILNSSTINLPDGVGVVLASKLSNGKIKSRIGGIDFAEKLISKSLAEGSDYAKTVICALNKIKPIDHALVPENSLIREFIPGGIYESLY